MQLEQLNILSPEKMAELAEGLDNVPASDHMLGLWDASTGFCVRVYTVKRKPVRWYICGPLSIEQAREELTGNPQPEASGSVH